jgi:homoserine dehydrogenase
MYDNERIIVLKFGSSVLRDESDLPRAVHEVYRWWRQGAQVLVVVSAFGNITDQLLRRAETFGEEPEQATLAALLATGEAVSSALLGLALNKSGVPARVLDPVQAGLRTAGGTLDADLVAVDAVRLHEELQNAVVVLPGFIGRGENGDTTLLGRGGSDLTALYLAHRLRGQCVLLKDVDGIYASDPATAATRPVRFAEMKYETATKLAGSVVQQKAIRFAASHRLPFVVTSIGSAHQTVVGSTLDHLAITQIEPAPLRVALLGCGTVGGGVYQALAALPELFRVTGVGTRNGTRALAAGVPKQLLTNDLEELIDDSCDVVIEAIGGTKVAGSLVSKALLAGRHVITANKALLATDGERLSALAADCGVSLRSSAAVGGAMPAFEAIARARSIGPLQSLRGVLNGTTNFVLDRLGKGEDLKSSVSAAQAAGYAEANCCFDLNGTDAAHKLVLLIRRGFGVSLPFDAIERTGIEDIDPQWVRSSRAKGRTVRLVASCLRARDGLKASVKPTELPLVDPLTAVSGVEIRLVMQTESGAVFTAGGKGAGRWPTTEAIMADLYDIGREIQSIAETEAAAVREECA